MNRINILLLLAVIFLTIPQSIFANESGGITFVAYPGTYTARLINIESAKSISLMVDVWDGFPKRLIISLPNVKLPVNHAKSKACEIKLLEEANAFTAEFFNEVKSIKVKDIAMERTDLPNGFSDIYTEKGSLLSKLLLKGLVRSNEIASDVPWC